MEPLLIAHRGNLSGRVPDVENSPSYIDSALEKGFDAEIDLWSVEAGLFLGHDKPDYHVSLDWLEARNSQLWIHCKNASAIEIMSESSLHWFFHETDSYTLTSRGFIWGYPRVEPVGQRFVSLWFESERPPNPETKKVPHAFCGDFVADWSLT